jgi:hypothetical protein
MRPYNTDDYFIKRYKDFVGTVKTYIVLLAALKRKEGIARLKEHKAAATGGEFEPSTANRTEDWGKRGPAVYTQEVETLRLAFNDAKKTAGMTWPKVGRCRLRISKPVLKARLVSGVVSGVWCLVSGVCVCNQRWCLQSSPETKM